MGYYSNNIQAGNAWEINVAGAFARIMNAGANVRAEFYKNGSLQSEISNVGSGFWRRGEFDRIILRNGATTNLVEIVTEHDEMGMDSFSIVGQQGAYSQTVGTVSNASGLILGANAGRRYLLIQNKDAAGNIYVNAAGVAATVANGLKIGPGQSLEFNAFNPTAGIYAIGDMANNPNIVIVEAS